MCERSVSGAVRRGGPEEREKDVGMVSQWSSQITSSIYH